MSSKYAPKILVVNDDAASLFALTDLLSVWAEGNGCSVIGARSGEEALRHVLQDDFAVILLDVNMPGMSGFETAEAIHQRPRSSGIPIIFVTAFLADEINKLKAYQQGAVDYLFTPIIPQVLQAKVSVFVRLAKKNAELKEQAETLKLRTTALEASNAKLILEMRERKLAVEQNKAKDEFLAMLGHELRNPLSAITSAASIIGYPGASQQSMERAKLILNRQTQNLTRIVDDLLDLGRVMSGKIILHKKPVNISDVVAACLESLKASRPVDSYQWKITYGDAWVEADPTRLEQIVTNLLDNAIKYTPAGGTIAVGSSSQGESITLSVEDSGIGIDATLLPHIFDVFVQGEHSIDRAKGGLGIGLALVRQLVQLHAGTIEVRSAGANLGSTFTLAMPRSGSLQAAEPAPGLHDALLKHKLLLIEDNDDGREMIVQLLNAYGFATVEASAGDMGIVRAITEQPDIAIIDIGLPGIDGYEVARRLRADSRTSAIRLIALTGYGLSEDRKRAQEAGFEFHLVKPFNIDYFIQALHTIDAH
ncbi:response regulator [Undibacterium sp.]|uniref:ATP-binding response regulator n=1 Tax=Undibacterium sp. TaxID=1914977 RepID=UPI00374CCC6A